MAVKFFNIRSKEVLVADTEEKISALWASSDRSPNITQGQDFGWRMAPEVVVEMKRIKQDLPTLQHIAAQTMRPLEDVGEPEILLFISAKTAAENAPLAQDGDYTDEYESEIRRLELEAATDNAPVNATPEQKESLADLRERVELAERLAAAQAAVTNPVPTSTPETVTTTTTEVPTTTTTTTKIPTTTTTTTKKS